MSNNESYFERKDDVSIFPSTTTLNQLKDAQYFLRKGRVKEAGLLLDAAILLQKEDQQHQDSVRKINITNEGLDDLVALINTAKDSGMLDAEARISADRDELVIDLSYSELGTDDDMRSIRIKLRN